MAFISARISGLPPSQRCKASPVRQPAVAHAGQFWDRHQRAYTPGAARCHDPALLGALLPDDDPPQHYIHPGGSVIVDIDTFPSTVLDPVRMEALMNYRACIFAAVTVQFSDVFTKSGDPQREAEYRFEFPGARCFGKKAPRISVKGNHST